MAGVGVQEKKIVTVTTTDGQTINSGDILALSIKGQDIVCRFSKLDNNSYFETFPLISSGGKTPVRYRLQSIVTCYKVKSFEVDAPEQALKEAAKAAADHADQDTLAPATEAE